MLTDSQLRRISREAAQVDVKRALLTVIGSFFYAVGFAIGGVFRGVSWCIIAGRVGFEDAMSKGRQPA